jgi:hypothetical protein
MFDKTAAHLLGNVLPAYGEYLQAEYALTAFFVDNFPASMTITSIEANAAKRRACDLAIALDGLTDRAAIELGKEKKVIRKEVAGYCYYDAPDGIVRTGAFDRVRAIANAYKHMDLSDPSLPIASEDEVLAVGTGYGTDGYGVGKYGGCPEVVIRVGQNTWKFMGDSPIVIAAWLRFLRYSGGPLADDIYTFHDHEISFLENNAPLEAFTYQVTSTRKDGSIDFVGCQEFRHTLEEARHEAQLQMKVAGTGAATITKAYAKKSLEIETIQVGEGSKT